MECTVNQPCLVFRSCNIREIFLRERLRKSRTMGLYFICRKRSSRLPQHSKGFFNPKNINHLAFVRGIMFMRHD